MALDVTDYPLEYVSGGIQLPPFGEGNPVQAFISVVNIGSTPASTKAVVFRRHGQGESVQVFDSDVNFSPELGPGSPIVAPHAQWLWLTDYSPEWTGTPADQYWFTIQTTSPNLVPSIEFVQIDFGADNQAHRHVFAHYKPGDFALFHRRVRLIPGVVVPEGGLVFE